MPSLETNSAFAKKASKIKATLKTASAGNWTRVCTVAGYYSTTRPLMPTIPECRMLNYFIVLCKNSFIINLFLKKDILHFTFGTEMCNRNERVLYLPTDIQDTLVAGIANYFTSNYHCKVHWPIYIVYVVMSSVLWYLVCASSTLRRPHAFATGENKVSWLRHIQLVPPWVYLLDFS